MPKVKKSNNNYYVLIPPDIVESLKLKEGEEIDFSKRDISSFVVSRRGAVVQSAVRVGVGPTAVELGEKELVILKKLDTMRYGERTKDKVDAMMSASEKLVLSKMLERKIVTLYRKDPKEPFKYGIAKSIYDEFLMRKGHAPVAQTISVKPQPAAVAPLVSVSKPPERKLDRTAVKKWEERPAENGFIEELETKGYVVLRNEADAAGASAALEDSIRQGLVLGTRAFDKKFYIGLRGFISRNSPKIMKVLEKGKSVSAEEIAAEVGIDADAVKTVLYILAEKGDVTEVRREVFRIA